MLKHSNNTANKNVGSNFTDREMNAALFDHFDFYRPENSIKYAWKEPVPYLDQELQPHDVLVQIEYASINAQDYKTAQGVYRLIPHYISRVLGRDGAGIVVRAGSAVSSLPLGSRVVGRKSYLEHGTFADYGVFHEHDLCIIPDGISFRVAAAYPTSLLVAYQALRAATQSMTTAQVQQANILVNGASGGIGSMVVLLSRHYFDFNHIFATTSTNNTRYVVELGADTVIDYTNTRFDQVIPAKALHIVIDCIGGYDFAHLACNLLQYNKGHFVSVATPKEVHQQADTWKWLLACLYFVCYFAYYTFVAPVLHQIVPTWGTPKRTLLACYSDGQQLHQLLLFLQRGNLLKRMQISEYDLFYASDAMRHAASMRTVGKLVLKVAASRHKPMQLYTQSAS